MQPINDISQLGPFVIIKNHNYVVKGDSYNGVEAIKYIGASDKQVHYWLWKCHCGNYFYCRAIAIRYGNTTSCGCVLRASRENATRTHGMRRSPEYSAWRQMKSRCLNPNNSKYAYYGGRGIRICDSWQESFEAFYKDMGPRPSSDHSVDRIDSNGDYYPENCRWSSKVEQVRNRRSCHFIELQGEIVRLADVAESISTTTDQLLFLLRRGYTIDEAIERRKLGSRTKRKFVRIVPDSEFLIDYKEVIKRCRPLVINKSA